MRFQDGLYPERAFVKVGGRMTLEGGGKSKPPPAPNYDAAAQTQAQSSKEVTNMQNFANRPNQVTPWGSSTWSTEGMVDPATGQNVTQWTQNLNIRPDTQAALDSEMAMQRGRMDLAASTMPRVQSDVANPWDFSQFTNRTGQNLQAPNLDVSAPMQTTQTTNEPMFSADRRRIEDAAFDRMRPEFDFQNEALRTRLSNQGLTEGSEAYNRAFQQQGDQQARERWNALIYGGTEQSRMTADLLRQQQQAFGQDVTGQQVQNQALQQQQGADITGANFTNQLRQQEIAEEAQRRGMSLNEMNALITGQQVQTPQMPGFIAAGRADPVQALSAAQMTGQSQLDAYNASQQGKQGAMSGLFGLGGSILGGPMGGMIGSGIGSLFG